MKKHWKKILLAFLSVLIIIGGYVVYIFQFKEYDVADKEVAEITKETYTLELPDGSVIELDEEGNIVESDESTNGSVTAGGTTSSNSNNSTGNDSEPDSSSDSTSGDSTDSESTTDGGTNSDSSNNGDTGGSESSTDGSSGSTPNSNNSENITVASIKDKYSPTMESLQNQTNERINSLVGRAMDEYTNKKANGESVNYAYFYNKYTSAAEELEGRTDTVFYQVVGIIEKELVANGYSKTHAQSIVNDYEAAKEARRSALIDKTMNR